MNEAKQKLFAIQDEVKEVARRLAELQECEAQLEQEAQREDEARAIRCAEVVSQLREVDREIERLNKLHDELRAELPKLSTVYNLEGVIGICSIPTRFFMQD